MRWEMTDNLWPNDFGDISKKTPVGILREQAKALGARTSNIVTGRIMTVAAGDGKFRHIFTLYCVPLGYSNNMFYIDHGIDLYPVEIFLEGEPGPSAVAETEEEFIAKLKDLFSREKSKKTIASLIAQSKE
jgi:hypothetical protein